MTNLEYLIPVAEKHNAVETNPIPELRVWTWEETINEQTRYMLLVGSTSKRKKKALVYEYATREDWRQRRLTKLVENTAASSKIKAERKAAKKNFVHTLEVGDILVASWGYEQTNINFYQVTKKAGKTMVEFKAIYKEGLESPDIHSRVIACKDDFVTGAETLKAKVQQGNMVKINSYKYARKWDGRARYETNSLYGH